MNFLLYIVRIAVKERSILYILYIKMPSSKAQAISYNDEIRLQTLALIEANITTKIITAIIEISYFSISRLQK